MGAFMPRCGAKLDEIFPLAKGQPGAPGDCAFPNPQEQPMEGFATG
jgi:hypothetical protein